MLGLVGLQIADAMALLAARAADHLMQQLERALGGARIARAEPEIGIDHADQIELREMMPLGDELRADHDVDAALLDVAEFLAHALDRGDEVARQHQDAPVGKQRGDFLLQPLHAGPAGDERLSVAWHFGQAAGGGVVKPQ